MAIPSITSNFSRPQQPVRQPAMPVVQFSGAKAETARLVAHSASEAFKKLGGIFKDHLENEAWGNLTHSFGTFLEHLGNIKDFSSAWKSFLHFLDTVPELFKHAKAAAEDVTKKSV